MRCRKNPSGTKCKISQTMNYKKSLKEDFVKALKIKLYDYWEKSEQFHVGFFVGSFFLVCGIICKNTATCSEFMDKWRFCAAHTADKITDIVVCFPTHFQHRREVDSKNEFSLQLTIFQRMRKFDVAWTVNSFFMEKSLIIYRNRDLYIVHDIK